MALLKTKECLIVQTPMLMSLRQWTPKHLPLKIINSGVNSESFCTIYHYLLVSDVQQWERVGGVIL